MWRAPADTETALFLGYARVLTGAAAARVLDAAGLPPAPALAVRRSALVATPTGDATLRGRVVSARATPEQLRLVVEVADVGELDAVAALDAHLAPGDAVGLRVEPTRVALVGQEIGLDQPS